MPDDTPAELQELMARLEALLPSIDAVDTQAAEEAATQLNARHPFDGEEVRAIRALATQGLDEGWLAPHDAGPDVKFGRLAKDLGGYAIDAVLMKAAAGRGHTHTRGEVNMCFPLDGAPRFDGREPGWVVFAPGSHHVPTVTDGTMLFLYFTPGGEVVWDPVEAGPDRE